MSTQTFYTAAAKFEAARQLDSTQAGHRLARLHGHGFTASVRCSLASGWASHPGAEITELTRLIESATAELDYQHLNTIVSNPSDAALAQWLRSRLQPSGLALDRLDLCSTHKQGVVLDAQGRTLNWRRYVFQSAHRLPNVPLGHKCGRMHGHGFEAILHVGADTPHDEVDRLWAPLHMALNYACLNDLPGLENPTSEVMSRWIWERLQAQLPSLAWVTVFETASCGASYDGAQHRIWKDMTLDSAVQLRHAPEGSPLRRLHGHTYTVRLHLSAPLDQVRGWTVDFGDVKEIFTPLFKQFDHHPLYELAGLDDCDTASLAHWVLEHTRRDLPQLDRVDLYETDGCGATAVANSAIFPLHPI